MKHTSLIFMLLAGLVVAPAGHADGSDSGEVAALRAEVELLRAELDEVKAQNNDDWLTEQRAEEIKGLVADVLADADTRAGLMQSGMTAGRDGTFFLQSADGNYRLNIQGQIQVRWAYNSVRGGGGSPPSDPQQWGFELRRVKLNFTGHIIDPSWQYRIQIGSDRRFGPDAGGPLLLEEAYIDKDFGNGWALRIGQDKGPMLREELVSSKRQLAVERSLITENATQDRSQGLFLKYRNDDFRSTIFYGDGYRTRNTPFNNTAANNGTEFAMGARAEWKLMGNWKQFEDFTSWSGDDQGLMLGVAAWWQNGAFGTANAGQEFTQVTADISWEMHPFNAFVYVIHRNTNDTRFGSSGTGARERATGVVGQVGYHFVPDKWELFGRYEWGDVGGSDAANAIADLSLINFGVNYYIDKHNAKWSTDFGYSFGQIGDVWDASGADWRPATTTGQYVIRSQIQLLF